MQQTIKITFPFTNIVGYIEKVGDKYQAWLRNHDDVIIIEDTQADAYHELYGMAWHLAHKDSFTEIE